MLVHLEEYTTSLEIQDEPDRKPHPLVNKLPVIGTNKLFNLGLLNKLRITHSRVRSHIFYIVGRLAMASCGLLLIYQSLATNATSLALLVGIFILTKQQLHSSKVVKPANYKGQYTSMFRAGPNRQQALWRYNSF